MPFVAVVGTQLPAKETRTREGRSPIRTLFALEKMPGGTVRGGRGLG